MQAFQSLFKIEISSLSYWEPESKIERSIVDSEPFENCKSSIIKSCTHEHDEPSCDLTVLAPQAKPRSSTINRRTPPGAAPSSRNSLIGRTQSEDDTLREVERLLAPTRAAASDNASTSGGGAVADPLWPSAYPLHAAAERPDADTELQRQLDALGPRTAATINEPDGLGRTPLHYAAGRGRSIACELLLRHGARAQLADAAGCSPLHRAAAAGHAAAAAALLAAGAAPDRRTGPAESATPLMFAARAGAVDCVAALLAAGADPAAVCAAGRTATEWARDPGPELLAMLRPRSAAAAAAAAAASAAGSRGPTARQAPAAPAASLRGDAEAARAECVRRLRAYLSALEAGRPAGPGDGPAVARLQGAVGAVGDAVAALAAGRR